MKKVLMIMMVFILLGGVAVADTFVPVKSENSLLTEEDIRKLAVDFFAEKCGIDEDRFENAKWEIAYGHSSIEDSSAAYWSVSVRSILQHERIHYMRITGAGEILYWEAHGPGYEQENPELLGSAQIIEPLDSDIQQTEVIQLVTEKMVSMGYCNSVEGQQLIIEAYFVYDDHFNGGSIPVWLVKIERTTGELWKAAITHNGVILALTEYHRDYELYTTPGEDFWVENFPGEEYFNEQSILADVVECRLSFEDRAFHTGRWRTLLLKWIESHPYYLNNPGIEYEIAIEHIYGIPDSRAISQEEAEDAAFAYLNSLVEEELFLTSRAIRTDYYVTDTENPQWVIRIGQARGLTRQEKKSNATVQKCYVVYVNAHSGMVSKLSIN